MGSIFSWLSDLMKYIGNLIPRFTIVKYTHGGVAFIRGKNIKAIKPGVFFYWPFWTEIMTYPVKRQSLNLPSQTLTTEDNLAVTVSAIVIYEVSDIVIALAEQWDLNETIRDLSLAAIKDVICESSWAIAHSNRKKLDRDLTKNLRQSLSDYGIKVLNVSLTDFAKTNVYTIVNGSFNKQVILPDGSVQQEVL